MSKYMKETGLYKRIKNEETFLARAGFELAAVADGRAKRIVRQIVIQKDHKIQSLKNEMAKLQSK